MAADKSDLELTLEKIDKLQGDLIKTQKFIKNANFDNIGQNLKTLLDTLARSFIPHLASEIDFILKTSGHQKESVEFFGTDEQMESSLCFPPIIINERDEFEIDVKEENIIRDAYEYGNEDPFQDFQGQEEQHFSDIAEQRESQQNSEISHKVEFNADGAYIISGTNEEKLKAVSNLIKKCLSLSGVKEGLGKFRNSSDTGYDCPFCEDGKLQLKDRWKFLRHLILVHADSDLSNLVPLPFVLQQRKGPMTAVNNQNLTYKCPKCSNSYNNETSLQWHLNFGHRMNLTNEQLAHETQAPFIITCSSDKEKQKSVRLFSNLCLKVPGTRETLMGFKDFNGHFVCPHCFPEKILMSPNVFDFMRHIIARDHATLIPLPYIRQEASARKILECESKESSDEGELEEQELNTKERNDKMLSNFIKKCLSLPGVKEGLRKFRNSSNTGYDCPSCPQGIFKLKKTWTLMKHIVRMHKDSDLIPLPYTKQRQQPSSTTSNKRKRSKSPADEWSSDEEELSSLSLEDSNNAFNELL